MDVSCIDSVARRNLTRRYKSSSLERVRIVTMRTGSNPASKDRPTLVETVAPFIVRRVFLLITVLILHNPHAFDNRLLVTDIRVPMGVPFAL
jgi:hypothetical protein